MAFYRCGGGQTGLPIQLVDSSEGVSGDFSITVDSPGDYLIVGGRDLPDASPIPNSVPGTGDSVKGFIRGAYYKTLTTLTDLPFAGCFYLLHKASAGALLNGSVPARTGARAYPTYHCYRIGEGAGSDAEVSIIGIVPYRDVASAIQSNNTYYIPETSTAYKSMYAQINGETINSQNLIYEKYSAPVYAAKKRYESGGSVISEEGYSAVYGETGIGVGLTVRAGINDGGRLRIDDYQKEILCVIIAGNGAAITSTSNTITSLTRVNPPATLSNLSATPIYLNHYTLRDFVSLETDPGANYVCREDRSIPDQVVWFCKFLEPVNNSHLALHISSRYGTAYILKLKAG